MDHEVNIWPRPNAAASQLIIIFSFNTIITLLFHSIRFQRSQSGLKTKGVLGPGLRTESVLGPGLKTGGVVDSENSADGGI